MAKGGQDDNVRGDGPAARPAAADAAKPGSVIGSLDTAEPRTRALALRAGRATSPARPAGATRPRAAGTPERGSPAARSTGRQAATPLTTALALRAGSAGRSPPAPGATDGSSGASSPREPPALPFTRARSPPMSKLIGAQGNPLTKKLALQAGGVVQARPTSPAPPRRRMRVAARVIGAQRASPVRSPRDPVGGGAPTAKRLLLLSPKAPEPGDRGPPAQACPVLSPGTASPRGFVSPAADLQPEPEPEPELQVELELEPEPELGAGLAGAVLDLNPSPRAEFSLVLVPSPVTSSAPPDSDEDYDSRFDFDAGVAARASSSPCEGGSIRSPRAVSQTISRTESVVSQASAYVEDYKVLGCLGQENVLRRAALRLATFAWFDRLVLVLIVVNCVIISLQVPSCRDVEAKCGELGHVWSPSRCVGVTAEHRQNCVLHGGTWVDAECHDAAGTAVTDPDVICMLPSVLAGYVRGGEEAEQLQADTELPFTIAFTVEAVTKIVAYGMYCEGETAYLRTSWNFLDALVVLTSWISILVPGSSNVSVFRVFRVLRPLRTMSRIPGMTTIIATLINAIQQLKDVLIMVFMVFIIFSILAVQFWTELPRLQCESPTQVCSAAEIFDVADPGCVCNAVGIASPLTQLNNNDWARVKTGLATDGNWNAKNVTECVGGARLDEYFLCASVGAIRFDDFFWTMITVFQVITLEGWTNIMYAVDDATEFSIGSVFFVSVVMFAGMFVMQLLLAVITKAYSDESVKDRATEKVALQAQQLEELIVEVREALYSELGDQMDAASAFRKFDMNQDGFMIASELKDGLERLLNRKVSRRMCARFVDRLDVDHDGKLAPDEFMAQVGVRVAAVELTRWERLVESCRRSEAAQENAAVSAVHSVMESNTVGRIVLLLIAANTVLLAMEYHDDTLCDGLEDEDGRLQGACMPENLQKFLTMANLALTIFFAAEMTLKLTGVGFVSYLSDPMNRFDGFIVIMSLLELVMAAMSTTSDEDEGGLMTIMRAGRLLRIFRSARKWQALRKVMATLMRTLPAIAPLSMLLFLLIVIYALLGMMLFGGKFYFPYRDDCVPWKECAVPRANFDDFMTAFVTVFQILTGEDWNMIMYDSAATVGMASTAYFVVVVIVGNYIVLSLFVAILLEGFQTDEANEEADQAKQDADVKAMLAAKKGMTPQKGQLEGSSGSADDEDDTQGIRLELQDDELKPDEDQDGDEELSAVGRITQSPAFENLIMGAILLSSAQLAYQDPIKHGGPNTDTFEVMTLTILDYTFLVLFTVEFAMKHVALGVKGYWGNNWNRLDGFIVMVGYLAMMADAIPSLKALRGIRALRALRPLRAMRRISGMKVTVNALLAAFPLVVPLGLVSMLFFMIFAILGVQLFAGKYSGCELGSDLQSASAYDSFISRCNSNPSVYLQQFCAADGTGMAFSNYTLLVDDFESYCQMDWSVHGVECTRRECLLLGGSWEALPSNFDTVWAALQTLSEMSSTEGWLEVMWSGADTVSVGEVPRRNANFAAVGFFILFMIIGKFFVLNLFTSALIDQFLQMQRMGEGIDMLTDTQRDWIDSQRKMLGVEITLKPPIPGQAWRASVYNMVESTAFEWTIAGVICANMVFLGTKHRGMEGATFGEASFYVNLAFTAIFALEALLKIIAFGRDYLKDSWNVFDITCVLASAADRVFQLGGFATFFRVIRIVRVTKIARGLVQLRQLLETMVTSVIALLNVGSLLFLLLFVYAVLGVALFHTVCTVPPPEAAAYDQLRDPCGDPDRLNFPGFYAVNATEAEAAWLLSLSTGQDPTGGWGSICLPGTLQCGDFHYVWQCENPDWLAAGNEPHCAGDGDAEGRPYHDCLCEEVNTSANFAHFGAAMLTLIRMSTGEFWNGLLRDMMDQGHTMALVYFGSYMVLSTLVVLNLLVATIVSNHEQAVDASQGAASSKKNLEQFKDAWQAIENRKREVGTPSTPGWIQRQDLRELMDVLSPPLGFDDEQGESERQEACKRVREHLPNHNNMIQLNETLTRLAGRHLPIEPQEELPIAVQRNLKRKQLAVVNKGRNPADIPRAALEEVFRILDSDGSGQLDRSEVKEALQILDLKGVDPKAAMKAMDEDGSGEVSFDEFADWWAVTNGVSMMSPRSQPVYKAGSPRGNTPAPRHLVGEAP